MTKSHEKRDIVLNINQIEINAISEELNITMLYTDFRMIINLLGAELRLKKNEIPE